MQHPNAQSQPPCSPWLNQTRVAAQRTWIRLLVSGCWLLALTLSLANPSFAWRWWQAAQAAAPPVAPQPAQAAATLRGFTHEWQAANNCGPATLAINLNYYGGHYTQQSIAQALRPNPNDQNVRPDELARYAIQQGFQATLRVNGTADLLRLFLTNGIPVLIETWDSDNPADLASGFAHFRLVTGYDDARQQWIVYDTYFARDEIAPRGAYQGMTVAYDRADRLWQVTNRKYIVVYPSEKAALVQQILGADADDATMWKHSLDRAQAEIERQPDNAYAWFNLGSSLYAQGTYAEAIKAFAQAQRLGLPARMFWYQYEPLEAYYAAGRYQELLALTNQALATATGIEELYYWKALALASLGDMDQARRNLQQALVINANYRQAQSALKVTLGG
jgi:tetratricopeptide (TPR) repeat protein